MRARSAWTGILLAPLLLLAGPAGAIQINVTSQSSGVCGANYCVSLDWELAGTSSEVSDESTFTLPSPDPGARTPVSAQMTMAGVASYSGVFPTATPDTFLGTTHLRISWLETRMSLSANPNASMPDDKYKS